MIKKILIYIVCVVTASSAYAQMPAPKSASKDEPALQTDRVSETKYGNSKVALADSAFVEKEYFKAIALYNEALATEGVSSSVYYNIGNAYYRVGQPGRAVLNYERALRVDPTNRQARLNLDFVNSRLADKPIDSGNIIQASVDDMTESMTADSWAWISVSLFILFLLLTAGYIFLSGITVRKICFFGGILVLFCTAGSAYFSVRAAGRIASPAEAIVIVPKSQLTLTPGSVSATGDNLVVHEGHKVTILDSVAAAPGRADSDWYQVDLGNNTRAWISPADIERISASRL